MNLRNSYRYRGRHTLLGALIGGVALALLVPGLWGMYTVRSDLVQPSLRVKELETLQRELPALQKERDQLQKDLDDYARIIKETQEDLQVVTKRPVYSELDTKYYDNRINEFKGKKADVLTKLEPIKKAIPPKEAQLQQLHDRIGSPLAADRLAVYSTAAGQLLLVSSLAVAALVVFLAFRSWRELAAPAGATSTPYSPAAQAGPTGIATTPGAELDRQIAVKNEQLVLVEGRLKDKEGVERALDGRLKDKVKEKGQIKNAQEERERVTKELGALAEELKKSGLKVSKNREELAAAQGELSVARATLKTMNFSGQEADDYQNRIENLVAQRGKVLRFSNPQDLLAYYIPNGKGSWPGNGPGYLPRQALANSLQIFVRKVGNEDFKWPLQEALQLSDDVRRRYIQLTHRVEEIRNARESNGVMAPFWGGFLSTVNQELGDAKAIDGAERLTDSGKYESICQEVLAYVQRAVIDLDGESYKGRIDSLGSRANPRPAVDQKTVVGASIEELLRDDGRGASLTVNISDETLNNLRSNIEKMRTEYRGKGTPWEALDRHLANVLGFSTSPVDQSQEQRAAWLVVAWPLATYIKSHWHLAFDLTWPSVGPAALPSPPSAPFPRAPV